MDLQNILCSKILILFYVASLVCVCVCVCVFFFVVVVVVVVVVLSHVHKDTSIQ